MMKNNKKTKPLVVIQCYEDRQQTLPLRKPEYEPADTTNPAPPKREAAHNPPPPPPMPSTNGQQIGETKAVTNHQSISRPIITPEVLKTSTLRNGTLKRTPTPDYNNKSDVQPKLNGKDDRAELESLESYKLKNPLTAPPKPPPNYFMRAPNGTATMKKIARPVSVTIGEYAGGGGRREPTKLDFLNGDKTDGSYETEDVPITNRLQSELALTLSRSNLRKKTEALADAGR